MEVNIQLIEKAIKKASKGRKSRFDVLLALRDKEYARNIREDIKTKAYLEKISYKRGEVTNKNGKHRTTFQPSFYTLVLQYVAISLIMPAYKRGEVHVGLNCLKGRGITAGKRNNSVLKRVKHAVYDRRDLKYVLCIDMRKCYEHIRESVVRKELKKLGFYGEENDFIVSLSFVGSIFPVGTPLSPIIHHVILLDFDKKIKSECMMVRYADNVICFLKDKNQANKVKWRIMFHWWYELRIRAKRSEIILQPIDMPVDICGYIVRRSNHINHHNKGTTKVRLSTIRSAKKSTERNYSSYFGLLKEADCYSLLLAIEKKMKLRELTNTIKIERKLDAQQISVKELADNGITFFIHDYEIKYDSSNNPNWLKCLIGIPHDGINIAREFHGSYSSLAAFLHECEQSYPKEQILPLEDVTIVSHSGYIFKDSTKLTEFL